MDTKITLSFDESAISKAKKYAEENNISLSRLTEFLYNKVTGSHHSSLEDYPIAEWVNMLSEGEVEYQHKPKESKKLSSAYFKNKK